MPRLVPPHAERDVAEAIEAGGGGEQEDGGEDRVFAAHRGAPGIGRGGVRARRRPGVRRGLLAPPGRGQGRQEDDQPERAEGEGEPGLPVARQQRLGGDQRQQAEEGGDRRAQPPAPC